MAYGGIGQCSWRECSVKAESKTLEGCCYISSFLIHAATKLHANGISEFCLPADDTVLGQHLGYGNTTYCSLLENGEKPVVRSHHLGLKIGNVAILLEFFKNMATWGYASQIRKRQLNVPLNANFKIYQKIVNFTFSIVLDYFLVSTGEASHLRALCSNWNSGTQPFMLDLQATLLCPCLPQVPATASFSLVARSIISPGICLFHPSPLLPLCQEV